VVTRYSCQGGKSFEGSAPSRMERPPQAAFGQSGAPPLKHGEPHGRLQGAIDLQSAERSKPSESGGTTRAERAWRLAPPGQREGFGRPGSGRAALLSAEGRSLNPKRGVPSKPPGPRARRQGRTARTGTLSSKERHGHEVDSWSSRPTSRPESAPNSLGSKGGALRERPNDPQDDRLTAAKRGLGLPELLTISDQANSRKAAPDRKERS
jgi:hypothetical protein